MYRISLTRAGNFAMPIDLDDEADLNDLRDLLLDGNAVVLAEELPDEIDELILSDNPSVEDVSG